MIRRNILICAMFALCCLLATAVTAQSTMRVPKKETKKNVKTTSESSTESATSQDDSDTENMMLLLNMAAENQQLRKQVEDLGSRIESFENQLANARKVERKLTQRIKQLEDELAKVPQPNSNATGAAKKKKVRVEKLIYAQDENVKQYCDGKYGDKGDYFSTDLKGLNRGHFRISFTFQAADSKSRDGNDKHYVLVLSHGWRVLSVYLRKDGYICLETDNFRHQYPTNLRYTPREDKHIDLEYDHGKVTINGFTVNVEMNERDGDNELSSVNYGCGCPFWGFISSVKVYNIIEVDK